MTNILKITTCLLLLFTLLASCREEQEERSDTNNIDNQTQKVINPNDSELTVLMRDMFDEALLIKQQIAEEEPIALSLEHEKILTAQATQPERIDSLQYQGFANFYLQTLNELQTASPARKANSYQLMVSSCVSCHQAMCPGPLQRIYTLQ
jgi:hypothetical protein